MLKSYVVEESDEEVADEGEKINVEEEVEEEEEEDEIIESDIELEGDTVEPDNDPPQKVSSNLTMNFCFNIFDLFLIVLFFIFGVYRWETLPWR